jgi:hypothetical protein
MSLGYPLLGFTRRPGDSPLGHAHAGAAKGQKSIRAVAYCGAKLEDLSPDILFPLDGPPVFSKDGEPVPLYHGGHPRACKACGQELLRLRRAKLAEMANQS